MTESELRADFEAWAGRMGLDTHQHANFAHYADGTTYKAWLAWREAAAKYAAVPVTETSASFPGTSPGST